MSLLPLALTGDRPTGPLHLGHYAGSLRNRVVLQSSHRLTVLIADLQALTDAPRDPTVLRGHIQEVMKDYLAIGLDPSRTTFVLQSAVPELAELTVLLLNLVSVGQLDRNPTVRQERKQKGMDDAVPAGFLCYPVSQAADILGLGGGMVPVGEDQLPMLELANVLADRVNHRAGQVVVNRCQAMLSTTPRLHGVDGKAKMGKSMGNAIPLSATRADLQSAVQSMYTDPHHLRVSDPGQVEGNVVFSYLDAFDPDLAKVQELKDHYRRGGLGDSVVKRHLLDVLDATLDPIRSRRAHLQDGEALMDVLRTGTAKARVESRKVLGHVRSALGIGEL